jgi:predicted DNA-binding protein
MSITPISSFRLSEEAKALLSALSNHYGITRTAALELVIRDQARRLRLKGSPK